MKIQQASASQSLCCLCNNMQHFLEHYSILFRLLGACPNGCCMPSAYCPRKLTSGPAWSCCDTLAGKSCSLSQQNQTDVILLLFTIFSCFHSTEKLWTALAALTLSAREVQVIIPHQFAFTSCWQLLGEKCDSLLLNVSIKPERKERGILNALGFG